MAPHWAECGKLRLLDLTSSFFFGILDIFVQQVLRMLLVLGVRRTAWMGPNCLLKGLYET